MRVPKYSYIFVFTDEGISDVLGKPQTFRYSELFSKRWYNIESGEQFPEPETSVEKTAEVKRRGLIVRIAD